MLRRIETDGGGGVAELARAYGVSTVTIHRDLEVLVGEGVVERVHGGCRPLTVVDSRQQSSFESRLGHAGEAKRMIAACAARLVNEGSTIFLDASTTCFALARELERIAPPGFTLVTNSPAIAYDLHAPSIHLIVTPGELDQNLRLIGGRWTVEFIAELNLETAFVSGSGLTLDNGLTTSQRNITDVLHAACAAAQETVALVDSSKFGTKSLLTIAAITAIDRLIVDETVDRELLAGYERAGAQVTVASAANAGGKRGAADARASHEDGATPLGPIRG
jgi:DeoR family fructose operon transcriptional repressor